MQSWKEEDKHMNKFKSALEVFDRKQKRNLVYMAIMIFLQSIAELLGVTIILPFINAIVDPDALMQEPYIRWIYDMLHMDNIEQLIILLAIAIIVIYILKNLFLIYVYDLTYRFAYYGKKKMQNTLMNYYIGKDYTFFLNINSSELIRNINTDPEMFYTAVQNTLQLITELVVSTLIIAYLLVKDIAITIGVAVSVGVMFLFMVKGLRKILMRYGDERRTYSANMLKCMQQAFGGIKEIKIANREKYFQNDFEKQNEIYTYVIKQNAFLSSIPKPIMEALCIAGLMAVIAVKVGVGNADSKQFVAILGVFAAAAFKLLPSVNKISSYFAAIVHNGVVIDKVRDEYREIHEHEKNIGLSSDGKAEETEHKIITLNNEIKVENLEFSYPDTEVPVLSNVSIKIPKNCSAAFIGPSGAGKTTFVDLILGILTPQKGKITVDNIDIHEGMGSWHDKIGYIPQTIYMLDDTIRNNIAFGDTEEINDERIWEALKQAQLDEFIREMEDGLDTVIGEAGVRLSGGQRQRIGIARALYRKPEVLVLDEATSALDNETEAAVMEAIDSLQGKMTMLIIAHRLSTIQNCDIVYKVDNGQVTVDKRKA
jgi:ABC-type multidrug transport system fused ATPase/permease subunit